ncbi:MFS transporter [Desulfospira joergensenii]|uniref:MFS transporter n=1 Tax=Desulfospira joergensenii TaxID=53329 RepID=UPI0003B414C0|nr:MFS transporter [Desulfospira joergensenii]
MFPILKLFIALYSSVFFLMTGLSLLNTFLSLRLSMEGISTQTTGVILTAYFMGLVCGTFFCKRVIRRVGHIRSFVAFCALTTVMVMVHGLYLSPFLWTGLRFVSGISNMGLFMVIESWLNECSGTDIRGRVFSIYMIMNYLGGSIGQTLLNAGDVETQTLYLVVGILMVLSIIPIALTHSIHPELPKAERIDLKTIIKKAPLGIMGCFATGLMTSAFYTMGPVFAHQIGLNVSRLSWFMTLTVLGGLVFQWPVGNFSDRFDRSLVLPALALIVSGICIVILAVPGNSFPLLLGLTTLFGGFIFTVYPVAVARAHDMFEPQDVVKVSSALLLAFGLGAVLGPVLASTFMNLNGSPYGFYYYYLCVSGLFGAGALVIRQREMVEIVPAEDQVDFVIMQETSTVAMHMDPRLETEEENHEEKGD